MVVLIIPCSAHNIYAQHIIATVAESIIHVCSAPHHENSWPARAAELAVSKQKPTRENPTCNPRTKSSGDPVWSELQSEDPVFKTQIVNR